MTTLSQAGPLPAPAYTSGCVLSADGTAIGYRQYGAGPALVLVQGAIGTVQSYHELASCLAPDFTVYVPERRGRPLSPRAYSPDQGLAREVEDVAALLAHSGARRLFGLSSGAVIALAAARVLPGIDWLVLYEPPLYVPPRQLRRDLVAQLNRELDAGQLAAALLTALRAAETAPPGLRYVPRPLLRALFALFLRWDARPRPGREYPPLREVVPTVRFDFQAVSQLQHAWDTFGAVPSQVMLLSGTRSPAFLRQAGETLLRVLPHAQLQRLPGLGHAGPWNANRGGQPAVVAAAMRGFLGAATAP